MKFPTKENASGFAKEVINVQVGDGRHLFVAQFPLQLVSYLQKGPDCYSFSQSLKLQKKTLDRHAIHVTHTV